MKKTGIPFEIAGREVEEVDLSAGQPYLFTWRVSKQGYVWWPGGLKHKNQVASCTPWFDESIPPSVINQMTGLRQTGRDPTTKTSAFLSPSLTQEPLMIPKGRRTAFTRPPLKPIHVVNERVVCLHREFAGIRDESIDADALRFASRYGPLLQQGHNLERDVEVEGGHYAAESLALWWDEALHMSVYLALWDLAESGKDVRALIKWAKKTDIPRIRFTYRRKQGECSITEYIDASYRKADYFERIWRTPVYQAHREESDPTYQLERSIPGSIDDELSIDPKKLESLAHPVTDRVARGWVKGYVADRMAAKLSPMKARLIPPRWEMLLTPPSLLDALWLMFAWEVSGMINPHQCLQCQKWFHREGKRTFCSNECYRQYRYHKDKREGKYNKSTGGKS